MTVDNISDIPTGLFIVGAVFILLIFSLLSLGILKMLQLHYRSGWASFSGSLASAVVFEIVLKTWFV
jgi:hypothetical protein